MPLISLFKESPQTLADMNIQQIVGLAGDGTLKDGVSSQDELHEYLSLVDAEKLVEYSLYCLENAFTDSGLVLQDVVNEVGRRLYFKVKNGRYRGVRNENGYDGIWESLSGMSYVVETKTTSAYSINLETIEKYRDGLVDEGMLTSNSAILFVVGRQETQALEQQIRGSIHAWSMRVIGVEALLKLMRVNISSLSEDVTNQIHEILKPIEYTRVDPIVEVIFATSEDRDENDEGDEETDLDSDSVDDTAATRPSNAARIKQKRQQLAEKFGLIQGKKLIRRKQALFSNPEDSLRVAISISKAYEKGSDRYWYSYIQPMRRYLSGCRDSYMIYGCLDRDDGFAIPYSLIEEYKEEMNVTVPKDDPEKLYYHVFIKESDVGLKLRLAKTKREVALDEFKF